MQLTGFSRQLGTRFRFLLTGRELPRLWAVLCLLPMLLMGAMSQAPHPHELQAMAQAIQAQHRAAAQSDAPLRSLASAPVRATSAGSGTVAGALQLGASHLEIGSAIDCLLCHWASVAAALLAIALALWLLLMRVPVRTFNSAFHFFTVLLALRSRAPPR